MRAREIGALDPMRKNESAPSAVQPAEGGVRLPRFHRHRARGLPAAARP